VLALLLWQWRPIPGTIWDVRGTALSSVLQVTFWIGWGILLVSTFLINHFELFGLAQVWAYFGGQEFHRPDFKTPSLYKMVRHPIYLGFVIAFWSAPIMTVGHLLFSVATTGYMIVGIYFEERDLLHAYGEAYRNYRQRVPMLIPFLKFRKSDKIKGKARGRKARQPEVSLPAESLTGLPLEGLSGFPGQRPLALASLPVHNRCGARKHSVGGKVKTLFGPYAHRKSSKDLLVGFNIPADWVGIR